MGCVVQCSHSGLIWELRLLLFCCNNVRACVRLGLDWVGLGYLLRCTMLYLICDVTRLLCYPSIPRACLFFQLAFSSMLMTSRQQTDAMIRPLKFTMISRHTKRLWLFSDRRRRARLAK